MAEVLSRSLQPAQRATAIAFILTIVIGIYFVPDSSIKMFDNLCSLLHITSLSIWVGTQFWVTFVAGLTMLKVLPRHLFGEVQSHLFRRYFFTGSLLSAIIFTTFILKHPVKAWTEEDKIQASTLLAVCLFTVANYLWLEPMTVKYMLQSHRYEREHGHGEGHKLTGEIEMNEELKKDQTYRGIRSKFFAWHGISSTANLISFAACGFRLWHLSKRVEI